MAADRPSGRLGLRSRITIVAALTVGAALLVGALLLVGLLRSRLDAAATSSASLRARDIAALAEQDALPATLALPGEESAFVQVVDGNGTVIASSENIEGESALTTRRSTGAVPLSFTMTVGPLDDAVAMRVIALNAETASGIVTVYAGESLATKDETTRAIITVLIVGLPLLLAIVGLVTWWSVARTLRPVRRITQAMSEITANDLHRRVPVPARVDEIGQLATTVNETLARLDTAVDRQRRFVADASHELRGPLAALRADLEISVAHPERTSWPIVAHDTLNDVERLEHLTDDLLTLARLDSNHHRPHQLVDLAAITTTATRLTNRPELTITTTGLDRPAVVRGDPDQLQRMVRNLVHNAEQHAHEHITIIMTNGQSTVRLAIADDGPGIPAGQHTTVFERFVRLDTARTRDMGGTGLGLAIVADVVAHHRGTITISETTPHGATFTVELPAVPLPD